MDPPLYVRAVYGIAISLSRFLIQTHAIANSPDYPMRSYTKNDVFIESILTLLRLADLRTFLHIRELLMFVC